MSFSADLKNEIIENKSLRARYKKAFFCGLFMFSKGFTSEEIKITTENAGLLKLYISLINEFLGRKIKMITDEKLRNGKIVYMASLNSKADAAALYGLLKGPEANAEILKGHGHVCAFLSGAYLACGNITDPNKSYQIEFVLRDEALCGELKVLLDSCQEGAKITRRRGMFVVYCKEYAYIEDLLTMMGAPKSCLKMIDVEMMKNVRNNVNRATNCETANIDKMVDAARSRTLDINLVLKAENAEPLPRDLMEIADLRLSNPDISLKELGAMLSPPLSRSGVYHRLERISRLADKIRKEQQ